MVQRFTGSKVSHQYKHIEVIVADAAGERYWYRTAISSWGAERCALKRKTEDHCQEPSHAAEPLVGITKASLSTEASFQQRLPGNQILSDTAVARKVNYLKGLKK
jgi:hypothetical protein